MAESVMISGFIYLTIYRIAVIAAGIICMILGFKLFQLVMPKSDKGSGVSVASSGFQFKAANIAPGTFFALFGAALIVLTLKDAKPEINLLTSLGDNRQTQSVTMRGAKNSEDPLDADNLDINSSSDVAAVINQCAWRLSEISQEKQHLKVAESLAESAVKSNPKDKNYLDTLNQIKQKLLDKTDDSS